MKTRTQLDNMKASELVMELRTARGKAYDQLEDELLGRIEAYKREIKTLVGTCGEYIAEWTELGDEL